MFCENHQHQIALVKDMHIVLLLQRTYASPLANGVDGVWQTACDRLQAILATG